ncbi:acyl-CoA dehydrogenase family protein [Streptomyces somaliensis DSM 40738]|uniref:Acyl-CoA dehydrogenase n=1 Tax=Streptomyces somaliensis (strain ATCC 33201 / DSM 40738 / JCM 12659 / KCTC 9044 / NCTC 11332 / NRRL B-12077 / IP 733) TaxID=1134445 RepID=A0AA44IDN2_STRE0|nr:acyl-CoA dehydrogenase family protein [Streptomyces somaliensis]MCQ0021790.1 acyl-CoA dehydrogenase family protein [Streptomyces somaliensis DSM 40738]NKY14468.1 acyl-CoA dehydrogenase [Streptomyces somaliensis DSM 40738]
MSTDPRNDLNVRIERFLAEYPPATTERLEWLRARFDAGLAWVQYPEGLGGLGLPRSLQADVDAAFAAAGGHDNRSDVNGVGLGMAAPTILAFGTEEQKKRFLRPLWTGEEIWCQLFSEPGAGSDLAALGTRAVRDGDTWVVNGQKVWTSGAHNAQWAILLARTNPDVPKHSGITYFLCPMADPGVDVRPLRQITGEAEFNEVFLDDVRISDDYRLGAEGEGWKIANATLNNERVAIGGRPAPREDGMVGVVARNWREHPERRTHALHDRLLGLWVEAEVARVTSIRLAQKLAVGQPGPEGSAMKLTFARLNQALSGLEVELNGADGLRADDWTERRPESFSFTGRDATFRYLRAKGNSIEGGTSEILKNIVSERVLGLPAEARTDKNVPWKELAR